MNKEKYAQKLIEFFVQTLVFVNYYISSDVTNKDLLLHAFKLFVCNGITK